MTLKILNVNQFRHKRQHMLRFHIHEILKRVKLKKKKKRIEIRSELPEAVD